MSNVEKKFTKKRIIAGILVFVLLAGCVFCYLSKALSMGDSDANRQTFKAFYAEKKNTIDVVYFGTSATNRYFINPMAYEDKGMTVFSIATMGMPMFFVPTLMDEVEKTQDPDLYIIELRWINKSRDQLSDAHIRRVTDNLKLSPNKVRAIDEAFAFMDGETGMLDDICADNKLEYILPIIKYHSKLEQDLTTPEDWKLTSTKNQTKGYVMSVSTTKEVNQFPSRLRDGYKPLTPETEQVLNDLLDKCDSLGDDKKVLFVLSPYSVKKAQMPVFNTAIRMVEDRGYPVINFNTEEMYEELNLDWDKDFYNSKHVNYKGAEKYTRWMEEYLSEHYDLEDHRGDAAYSSWDEAFNTYKEYTKDGIKKIGHKDRIGGPVKYIKKDY